MAKFLKANPSVKQEAVPTDLLTASGSGFDPHIRPASAAVQIPALVKATGLSQETLEAIVKENTQGKFLVIFGEETVNVLMVNLDIAKELGLVKQSSCTAHGNMSTGCTSATRYPQLLLRERRTDPLPNRLITFS